MSAEQLTIMLNKQCGGVISKAKTKVKAEGKKQVMKVLEKLPSKDDIKEKLISGACSPKAQEKMKKIYNKIHGLISKLENILLKAQGKLQSIKAKIDKVVNGVLPKLVKIMGILALIILVVKIIVAISPAILVASSGLLASGIVIVKIANAIMKAQSIVAEYDGTIKAITDQLKKYLKIALKIIASIAAAILLVSPILKFVQKIKAFIEFLYLMYLSMCNTSDTSVMDSDGTINEKLLEEEILSRDPTGIGTTDIQGFIAELQASGDFGKPTDLDGLGNASGTENTNQGTNYGLGGTSDGLNGYGNTGIMATTSGWGHTGLGNDTRPNDELYGISEKLNSLYEDLIIELQGQGKQEIVEHLNALDFGFKTRFERKIIPIT
tara:strand:+ start:264 stop:1403 length:1140 start_codon:yes stop_codon:yes gene_type:complete